MAIYSPVDGAYHLAATSTTIASTGTADLSITPVSRSDE